MIIYENNNKRIIANELIEVQNQTIRNDYPWSSHHGAAETDPTRNHEIVDSIPGLAQWVKDGVAMSCSVGHRCSSDLALMWLWLWLGCRPAAVALITCLAWELPYAVGVALKSKKKKKRRRKERDDYPKRSQEEEKKNS